MVENGIRWEPISDIYRVNKNWSDLKRVCYLFCAHRPFLALNEMRSLPFGNKFKSSSICIDKMKEFFYESLAHC